MAKAHPPMVDALLRRVFELFRVGNPRAAIPLALDAVRQAPRSAAAHAVLGALYAALPAHRLAVQPLRRAVALEGTRADHHHMLGVSLQVTGCSGEAAACFEKAIALDPKLAAAHESIVELHRKSNRPDAARAALARALRMLPAHAGIQALRCESMLLDADAQGARDHASRLLDATPELPKETVVRLLHTLSCAREKLGDHLGAFDASASRNAIHLTSHAVQTLLQRDPIGGLMRRFEGIGADTYRAWSVEPPPDALPTPAFLVGFPRSGTTMTENILGSHPGIVTTSERPMLVAAADDIVKMIGATGIDAVAWESLPPEQIARFRAAYWHRAEQEIGEPVSGRLLVDKFPMHLARLGLINRVFPRARVVVALRDPRDCVLSAFMQHFNLNSATARLLNLTTAAELYRTLFDFYLAVRQNLSIPLIEVRYEDTVIDLKSQARRMLDFLAVEWDDRVLRPEDHAAQRYIATPSWAAVNSAVNTAAIGRWLRYRERLEPVLPTLAPFVAAFGYAAS